MNDDVVFFSETKSVKKLEKTIHRVRIGPYWGKVRIQQVKGMYETQYPGARNLFIIKKLFFYNVFLNILKQNRYFPI